MPSNSCIISPHRTIYYMSFYCDKCEREVGHKSVHLNLGGEDICIDEGMSEFIELLWTNGIITEGCCEGREGTIEGLAYVAFPNTIEYEKFLYLIHKILYEKYNGDPNGAGARDMLLEGHVCRQGEPYPYISAINFNSIEKSGWGEYHHVARIDGSDDVPPKFTMSNSEYNSDKYRISWIVDFPFLDVVRMVKLIKKVKTARTVIIQNITPKTGDFPSGAISVTGDVIKGFGAYQTSVLNNKKDLYAKYITDHVTAGDLDPLALISPCLNNLYKPERFHEAGKIEVFTDADCPSDEELESLTYIFDKPFDKLFNN